MLSVITRLFSLTYTVGDVRLLVLLWLFLMLLVHDGCGGGSSGVECCL